MGFASCVLLIVLTRTSNSSESFLNMIWCLKKIDCLRKKGPNNEITPFSCNKGDVRNSKLRKKRKE